MGPTAIMAIMTGDAIRGAKLPEFAARYATLLTFLSGVICFLFGLLRLGFLIDFISVPVISGFTSAAALTIASGQIKGSVLHSHWSSSNETRLSLVESFKVWLTQLSNAIKYQLVACKAPAHNWFFMA